MARGRRLRKSGGGELEINKQNVAASNKAILLLNVVVSDEAILLPNVAVSDFNPTFVHSLSFRPKLGGQRSASG